MGIYSGPLNPVDGLVFHIEPTNSKSYPGTGVTFYDLVTGGIGGTLTNGPTYDVSSKGGFYFDGVDDYAICGRRQDLQGTNTTLSVWAKFYSLTSGDVAVCFGWTDGVNWRQGNGIGSYAGYIRSFLTSLFYTGNLNDWYHVALTSNEGANNLYINGIGVSSSSGSLVYASTNLLMMGWGGSGYGSYGKFTLGSAKIFNRWLAASEVLQEYNASKKRYFPEENIVTNGLILNIDPSKPSSYAGSGNTIYDLSGSNYNFALDSGITFDGLKSGSLYFDGTKKAITNFTWPNNFTVDITFKLYANNGYFFSRIISTGNNDEFEFAVGQSGLNEIKLLVNGWVNTSQYITADVIETYTITRSPSTSNIYINGILIFTTSVTTTVSTSLNINLACRHSNQGQNTRINIYNLKIYNKVLTATEIEQNYNALRGRYNI